MICLRYYKVPDALVQHNTQTTKIPQITRHNRQSSASANFALLEKDWLGVLWACDVIAFCLVCQKKQIWVSFLCPKKKVLFLWFCVDPQKKWFLGDFVFRKLCPKHAG